MEIKNKEYLLIEDEVSMDKEGDVAGRRGRELAGEADRGKERGSNGEGRWREKGQGEREVEEGGEKGEAKEGSRGGGSYGRREKGG
ncbi:hypothetical protein ACH5RR_021584 [Cinchona calisaya]|uniref:Uncharacterized protein n=1 Tax=Cinchona calisaya TaxID=153742 RepID=A0ABD2ZKY4_9GENT